MASTKLQKVYSELFIQVGDQYEPHELLDAADYLLHLGEEEYQPAYDSTTGGLGSINWSIDRAFASAACPAMRFERELLDDEDSNFSFSKTVADLRSFGLEARWM